MSLKELYVKAIAEGMKAAEMVTDPAQKAQAYASIASAIAKSGAIKVSSSDTVEDVAPATATTGKAALKNDSSKAKKPTSAPAPKAEAEEPAEPQYTEADLTDNWDEAAVALKGEQINFLNQLKKSYSAEELNACVEDFTEGAFNTLDAITPLNIDGFIEYINQILAQQE